MPSFHSIHAKTLPAAAVLLITLLTALPAQAHLKLMDPVSRTDTTELIEDPCGGTTAGASAATYTAGTNIEITVSLAVQHVETLHAVISYDNFATRSELAMVPSPRSGMYDIVVPLPQQPSGSAILQATDGTYVSCADITLLEAVPFEINAGLNDAWYFPGTSGQGFFIIVYPDIELLFLAWFTYDTERPADDIQAIFGEPGHRWITAQGSFAGDTALLDITLTQGGVLDMAEPQPENSEKGSVGSMEVIFENCSEGVVKYDMPGLGLVGEVPIQRVANDNVALCEALNAQ